MKNRIITILSVFSLVLASGCGMISGYSYYIGAEKGGSDTGSDSGVVIDDGSIWVSPDGDDSGSGTIASPYLTIGKGVAAAVAAGGSKEVHVVGGTYDESVTVGDASSYYGVRILGGYGAFDTSSATRSRDAAVNVTKLARLAIDGSFGAPANGADSFVEGMTLFGLSIKNASPTISGNVISQGSASGVCRGGAAVTIETSAANNAEPVFSNNLMENKDCAYGGSVPIYVAVEARSLDQSTLTPRFESNKIVSGTANTADIVLGLIAHAAKSSKVEPILNGNTVSTGAAAIFISAINIWADSADSTANLNMAGNEVRAGSAPLSNGVDLGYDSIHDMAAFYNYAGIARNKIVGGDGGSLSTALSIANSSEVSSVVNNFISAGKSQDVGVWLSGINLENANADIINNTIVADSADIATLINLISANGATNIVNNIMSATGAGAGFTGISEQAADSAPATVLSNLFDSGLHVIYTGFAAGDILTVADLAISYPLFDPNYFGDALLVDPANMDLHISDGSAAIDIADEAFAPATDFDGAARPLGAASDIGADESM